MSRTIEAIMRHMASPAPEIIPHVNGTEKLEEDVIIKKQRYVWSEARFVRTMCRFHCDVRVAYNGEEVDGKTFATLSHLLRPKARRCGSALKVQMPTRRCRPSNK